MTKDPDYPRVNYVKRMIEVANPTLELPAELIEQLHGALERALWDVGKITKDSTENHKRVDPIKYINISEGFHNITFSVKEKDRANTPPDNPAYG
jgi:hypothetical protein